MDNALSASPTGAGAAPDLHSIVSQAHDHAKALFKMTSKSRDTLDAVQEQLAELSKLGDTVSQEDLVKAAGHLVTEGLQPAALAGLLADAPEKGEALAGWVSQMSQKVQAQVQQAQQQHTLARHELGVSGLRQALSGHGLLQQAQPEGAPVGAPAEGPSNALTAGA